jgi:hypothetical protein
MHIQRWWLTDEPTKTICWRHGAHDRLSGCPFCMSEFQVMVTRAIEEAKRTKAALAAELAERERMMEGE